MRVPHFLEVIGDFGFCDDVGQFLQSHASVEQVNVVFVGTIAPLAKRACFSANPRKIILKKSALLNFLKMQHA